MQLTQGSFRSSRSFRSFRHIGFATLVLGALAGAGCADDEDPDESEAASEFRARARGAWRLERTQTTPVGTAYIVQTITLTDTRETLRVDAFGDAAKTIPLLTYESSGPYEVVGLSAAVADAFELELVNDTSVLTAFVVDPAFLQATGLDDCGLAAGVPKDISNGCGAPLFQVTDCVDLDLFQVARGGTELRTGAPGTDRCVQRPTTLDSVPYLRIAQ